MRRVTIFISLVFLMLLSFQGICSDTEKNIGLVIDEYTKDRGPMTNEYLKLLRKLVRDELSDHNVEIEDAWINKILNYRQPFEEPNAPYPSVSRYLEEDLIINVLSRKDVQLRVEWIDRLLSISFRPHIKEAVVTYIFSRKDSPFKGEWFSHRLKNNDRLLDIMLTYAHFRNFIRPAMEEFGVYESKYNVRFLKMAMRDSSIKFDELSNINIDREVSCSSIMARIAKQK